MITLEPEDGVIVSEFAQRIGKVVVDSLNNQESNIELVMSMLGEVVLEIDDMGKRLKALEAKG